MNRSPRTRKRYAVALLNFVRKRTYGKRSRYKFPALPTPLQLYVTQGAGKLLIGSRLHDMQAHRLYYIAAGTALEISLRSERIAGYVLSFSHLTGEETGADRFSLTTADTALFPSGHLKISLNEQLAIRFRDLEEAGRRPDAAIRIQLQFQELLHLIVQKTGAARPANAPSAAPGIGKAIDFMQANYHERLDMGTLSAMANLTPSSFSRLFKKKIGESPNEYLTKMRMDNAKKLLSNDDCKIKSVSEAVGYDDEFHFSRVFHRTVGVSPTMYVKRNRLKVATASYLPIGEGLLSLDVRPVATVNLFRYPGMEEREYETLLASQREALLRAKPDIILCDFYHEQYGDVLRAAAPVVKRVSERKWSVYFRKLAEMLGRSAEAERIIADLTMQITAAKRALETAFAKQSVLLVQIGNQDIRIQSPVDHPIGELLYAELGLKSGSNVPVNARRLEVLPERMPQVDADYVFVFQNHIRGDSGAVYERLRQSPVWQAMKAVRNGNVIAIPNWFKMSWSPEGRSAVVKELLAVTGADQEIRGL